MKSETEIHEQLERLRKQYDESVRNPVIPGQDRCSDGYFGRFDARSKQLHDEVLWICEIAILEWVLEEKQNWLTSWMIAER